MLSLKLIREQTSLVREGLAKKHETAPIDEILSLDERRRHLLSEVELLRAQRNTVSQQIARMKVKPPELIAEMRQVNERIKELDAQIVEVEPKLNDLLLYVPNLPDESVPVGKD